MRKRIWWALIATALTTWLAGCANGGPGPGPDNGTPKLTVEPAKKDPPPTDDATLAALLGLPRAELAKQADACLDKIRFMEKKQQPGAVPFRRLPNLRLALTPPVFQDAKYSDGHGFSVPPYLAAGAKDSAVALHLARFGDVEAARKLVEPGDEATRAAVEALAGPKNYPVEWSRLAALLLHSAQCRLAADEDHQPDRLLALHQQLVQALDAKARGGPLGAALLPRGHGVLKLLAADWRAKDLTELADAGEKGLAAWGTWPALSPAVRPGKTPRAEVARLLGVADAPAARALTAATPARAIDLLGLPVPAAEAEGVVASFDGGHLAEVLIAYRARIAERYLQPVGLAHGLEENKAGQALDQDGLAWRRYDLDGGVCTVALVAHNFATGGLVRLNGGAATAADLPRHLGPVHLDHGFERNRHRHAPHLAGATLVVDDPDRLKVAFNPLAALTPEHVTLHRHEAHDVVARWHLQWDSAGKAERTFGKFGQLFALLGGVPRVASSGSPTDGHLDVVWQDARTRFTLRLPNQAAAGPELEVADLTAPGQLASHAAKVRQGDLADRLQRLQAGKPEQRLDRQFAGLALGSPRAEVAGRYPAGKVDQGDTLAVRFQETVTAGLLWQEVVARFDAGQKAAELRFRFRDDPAKPGATAKKLAEFKKRFGEPRPLPAPWATVWPGKGKGVVLYRWHDDRTAVTWQQDGGGVEVTLRDCPPEHPDGTPLPPLALLDRGPAGCRLGDARADVLTRFTAKKIDTPDGPWQLTPKTAGPYDVLVVWFEQDKVARVVAYHKGSEAKLSAADAAKRVAAAWAEQTAAFGWPRRQEANAERQVEAQGNHDDRTRVRVFWRKQKDGTGSLCTEWAELTPGGN